MRKIYATALTGAVIMCLASTAHAQQAASLTANLVNDSGKTIGTATFRGGDEGILISVDANGLTPGWHGVHVHAVGDCSDPMNHFKMAGSHLADEDEEHGYFNPKGPHKGDLPNIWIDQNGGGKAEYFNEELEMEDLTANDGAALMIHEKPDNYAADPSGDSGERLACGVVGK